MSITVYATQNIQTEYDLEFHDILELIDDLTESEKEELRNVLYVPVKNNNILDLIDDLTESKKEELREVLNKPDTLYDDLKFRLMTAALKKYDLDELQKRLEIIYY